MNASEEIYQSVLTEIDNKNKVVVATVLKDNPLSPAQPVKFLFTENNANKEVSESTLHKLAEAAFKKGELQYENDHQGTIYIAEPYFPESHLIILGGGHIAKPLAEFGAKTGFSVTVVDDRPSFANKQRFPYANKVICESFDKCIPQLNINRSCFVVIITRGHRHDLDCLRQVLGCETAYTGMIGSKRRVMAARKQLLEEGYQKEKLDAVRAPIGLDIGAQTPEEISISILSEAIQYKRKSEFKWPELDIEVLSELSENGGESRAIA
ncbi:MAG: XdhC family protein, partial [Eubacteriales bacterium]